MNAITQMSDRGLALTVIVGCVLLAAALAGLLGYLAGNPRKKR